MSELPGVYVIKNKRDGKLYVGSSLKPKARIKHHIRSLNHNKHFNEHLQNAWKVWGIESFMWEVIEVCTSENRLKREQEWIETFRTNEPSFGYNKAYPVRTVVSSKRMSDIHKAYWGSLTGKARVERLDHFTDPNKNRKTISATMANLWQDPTFRAMRLAGLDRGREKINANPSAAQLAALDQARDKAIEKMQSPEGRANQSLNNLRQWQDPKIKAARLASLAKGREMQHLRAVARRAALKSDNDIV